MHAGRLFGRPIVVAAQVEDAVDHEEGDLVTDGVPALTRLCASAGQRNDDFSNDTVITAGFRRK
jgi:hypothetical protein